MITISVSELKANPGKFVQMASEQDILITKNGKVVAKLVTAKEDKVAAYNHLMRLFPEGGLDIDPDAVREERLR